ncbi:uncharacterized protein BDZ99DRAFT_562088 [Mytilinidion resinicola]|uniref:Serine hydrolase domain-containing protein n=1 Tax=Mytilinidion resinicola TaxID=574789 RepID=A0A6A6YQG4_9PEZI|nr:uncharacterized protein BDZ99DRAFT_562088 [Mytilinidion resinicola]KAF2811142.1 hypothetical protein BDZ99DRAFT_562088 [Mytilinidion resinicola]
MRFLCLHGLGTNSEIFSAQTVSLRYEMEEGHTFDFVEGTIPASPAPETTSYYPDAAAHFNYFDLNSVSSMQLALEQLDEYVKLQGPYDGVIAYSHGAALVATYIVAQTLGLGLNDDGTPRAHPFKCAIFISGARPADPKALQQGELRLLNAEQDGVLLRLPTAHIWGTNDALYPDTSEYLSQLCDPESRAVFLHEEGHNVPSGKAREAVLGASKAIRRTVDKAMAVVL